MRLLVTGDRNWTNYNIIFDEINLYFPELVIEGEARGADLLAARAAKSLGIAILRFPADWFRYGKSAGPIRNRQMVFEGKPTFVLAFHDNIAQSKGTADMIAVAKKNNIPGQLINSQRIVKDRW